MKITKIKLEFKLQDFWVGVFWKTHTDWNFLGGWELTCIDIWICLVPFFPIHIALLRTKKV